MGLVNKVVPLEQLEDEYVQWAEEMMLLSPLALRMIKAGLNAELDGQAGIQELAGDATLLYFWRNVNRTSNNIRNSLKPISQQSNTEFIFSAKQNCKRVAGELQEI